MSTSHRTSGWIVVGLVVAVQIIDVAVHVAVDQVEPVRVLSNTVLAAASGLATVVTAGRSALLGVGGAVYLALNIWFLWDEGVVNPATDSLRLPLFAFVGTSLALVAWQGRLGESRD